MSGVYFLKFLKVIFLLSPFEKLHHSLFYLFTARKSYNVQDKSTARTLSLNPCLFVCLFVFLALQPIVVVFSQPDSGL